jgi:hypothetical protein
MNAGDAIPPADLEERLQFETLLTEPLARFVNIPDDQVDGAIQNAQQRICEALGLDRSILYELREPSRDFVTTRGWTKPEFKTTPPLLASNLYPWAAQQVLAGRMRWLGASV